MASAVTDSMCTTTINVRESGGHFLDKVHVRVIDSLGVTVFSTLTRQGRADVCGHSSRPPHPIHRKP
jgi:hypothetical protein